MAQQVLRVRCILPTALATQDNASFDLTFEATGSDTTIPITAATTTPLAVLYDNFLNRLAAGQAHTVASYLGDSLSRASGAVQIEYYDVTNHLDGSSAGNPITISTDTLGASTAAGDLPLGVALPIGIRAAYGTDIEHGVLAQIPTGDRAQDEGAPATHSGTTRPRARDRGRFYLGPLDLSCLEGTPGDGAKWKAAFVTDVSAAIDAMAKTQNSGAHDQYNMVVWSRAAQAVKTVAFYALSDFPGYQRRRTDETINRVHNWTAV